MCHLLFTIKTMDERKSLVRNKFFLNKNKTANYFLLLSSFFINFTER